MKRVRFESEVEDTVSCDICYETVLLKDSFAINSSTEGAGIDDLCETCFKNNITNI